MKKYKIPVSWEVFDFVEIEANNPREAVEKLKENIDEIPLGTEPEYIDGSYKIEDGNDGMASIDETLEYLKKYYNMKEDGDYYESIIS